MLSITGARLGEIAGLRWNDVDFRAGTITITVAADTRKRAYRERRSNDTLASFQNLVFIADDGRPLRHRSIQLPLRRTLKGAGLPRMRLHDLRYSESEIMALAGHAGLDSTKPYIHNNRVGHNILDTINDRRTKRRTMN